MLKIKAWTIGAVLLLGSSCSFIPDNFDSVEFGHLAELKVTAGWSDTCKKSEVDRIKYHSRVLVEFSKNTLNSNVASIYTEINGLAEELSDRVEQADTPSPAYCKIKRGNITKTVDMALDVFGGRKK